LPLCRWVQEVAAFAINLLLAAKSTSLSAAIKTGPQMKELQTHSADKPDLRRDIFSCEGGMWALWVCLIMRHFEESPRQKLQTSHIVAESF
jgi:hypothetical protein